MKKRLAISTEKPSAMEAESGMIELNRLDEADVRHDRCPVCKNKELNRLDGFKVCPRCNTNFKVLDGKAYIIDGEKGAMNVMENRIVARLKKMAENEAISPEVQAQVKELAKSKVESAAEGYIENNERIYEYVSDDMTPDLIDWLNDDLADICGDIESELQAEGNEALTKFIEEAVDDALDNLDPSYVKNFDSEVSDTEEQVKEDKEINNDPWRGTGMSQSDFI